MPKSKTKPINHDKCKYNPDCTEPKGICSECYRKLKATKGWQWEYVGKKKIEVSIK